MPRQACIGALGALHHIIIQEIERKRIFEGEKDRKGFRLPEPDNGQHWNNVPIGKLQSHPMGRAQNVVS